MSPPLTIRRACPSEIDLLIAIDNDACSLYEEAGIHLDLDPQHPFCRAERMRWSRAAGMGDVFLAEQAPVGAVGMMVVGLVDGASYLDQLSVRRTAMRRGIGRRLLGKAVEWAATRALWLTTYGHLPWNRPFYESAGFVTVPEERCPFGIVEILAEQRRWLPVPSERVAMRRDP